MGSVPVGRKKRADAAGTQTFRSSTAIVIWWVWVLFAVANLVDIAVQGRDHLSLVAAAILVLATGAAYVTAQRPRIIADDAGITIVNPLRDHHVGWAGVTEIDLADLLRVHCVPGDPAGTGTVPPGQEAPGLGTTGLGTQGLGTQGLGTTGLGTTGLGTPGPEAPGRRAPGRGKSARSGPVISSWAVHYSRRRALTSDARARRTAARMSRRSGSGLPIGAAGTGYGRTAISPANSPAEAEAEKIARVLGERATAARAEAVWAEGTVQIAGSGPAGAAQSADPQVRGWYEPLTSTWNRRAIAALLIPALILLIVCLV